MYPLMTEAKAATSAKYPKKFQKPLGFFIKNKVKIPIKV